MNYYREGTECHIPIKPISPDDVNTQHRKHVDLRLTRWSWGLLLTPYWFLGRHLHSKPAYWTQDPNKQKPTGHLLLDFPDTSNRMYQNQTHFPFPCHSFLFLDSLPWLMMSPPTYLPKQVISNQALTTPSPLHTTQHKVNRSFSSVS